jgi:uncharacterized protein
MNNEKGDYLKLGVIGLVSGLIFSAGLFISEMTNPSKIMNFLDMFRGNWDPSLAFVMIGGIGTYFFFFKFRGKKPVVNETFSIPNSTIIDKQLIIGQTLFGVGFGLSGLCVGPSIANILAGRSSMYMLIVAMLVGSLIYQIFHVWRKR